MRPKEPAWTGRCLGISMEVRHLRLILILLPREKDFSDAYLLALQLSASIMDTAIWWRSPQAPCL